MILTFAISKLIKRDTYFFFLRKTHSILTWSIILSSQIAMTLTNTIFSYLIILAIVTFIVQTFFANYK